MKIKDEIKDKVKTDGKKLRYEADDAAFPPALGLNLATCREREEWLTGRLAELEKDPKVKEVIVTRGSLDDVIGIQTSEG